MDIQDLRIFDRVAAVQNLSAVGNEFSLTPGTISKRLQSLEDDLGVQLFLRSTRSINITEEGRIFLEHAQRMLSEYDTARASVDANRNAPRGLIKMSAPAQLGNRDLGEGLLAFMAAYPEIDICTEVCERGAGAAEDSYDITIKTGVLTDSALIAKRLADDPMIIVASPDYLRRNGTPSTPQDLDRHSCLVHGDVCHWPFRNEAADRSVRVAGRLRTNDRDLLRRAACNGLGIARLSAAAVDEDLRSGRLVAVLVDHDTSADNAIWAIFPKSKTMLPRIRVLLDFLADWLKEPSPAKNEARRGRADARRPAAVFKKEIGAFGPDLADAGTKQAASCGAVKAARQPRPTRPGSDATA